MTSIYERRNFIKDVIPECLLEDTVFWIKSNMKPEDVFDKDELEEWAIENDFVEGEV